MFRVAFPCAAWLLVERSNTAVISVMTCFVSILCMLQMSMSLYGAGTDEEKLD